jgi:hypothetical protein
LDDPYVRCLNGASPRGASVAVVSTYGPRWPSRRKHDRYVAGEPCLTARRIERLVARRIERLVARRIERLVARRIECLAARRMKNVSTLGAWRPYRRLASRSATSARRECAELVRGLMPGLGVRLNIL